MCQLLQTPDKKVRDDRHTDYTQTKDTETNTQLALDKRSNYPLEISLRKVCKNFPFLAPFSSISVYYTRLRVGGEGIAYKALLQDLST